MYWKSLPPFSAMEGNCPPRKASYQPTVDLTVKPTTDNTAASDIVSPLLS